MVTLYTIYSGYCKNNNFENIEWHYIDVMSDAKNAYKVCETWAKTFHRPYRIMRTDYTDNNDGNALKKINDSVFHISLPSQKGN